MGTLSIHGLHGSFKQQWTQIKSQYQTIVKNNYSEQQFKLISVPLTLTTNLKPYFSRQIFLLPKTPKVIVLEKQKEKIFILVEHPQASIVEILKTKNCQLTILLFLRDIANAVYALKKKYQPFLVTQKMIKMCKNQNILVWFNQRYESNLVQLPVQRQLPNHQQIMIQSIINIFLRYSKCKTKILAQKFCSFIQFKQKIQSEINLQEQCKQTIKSPILRQVDKNKLFLSQKQTNNRISLEIRRGQRNSLQKKVNRMYLSNQKETKLLRLHSSKQLKTKNNIYQSLKKRKINVFSSSQESSKQQSQKGHTIVRSAQKKFNINIKKIHQKQEKVMKFSKHNYLNKKTVYLSSGNIRQNLHFQTSGLDHRNRFSSQSNTQKKQIDPEVQIFKGNTQAFKKKGQQQYYQEQVQFEPSQSNQFLKSSKGSKNSDFTSVGSFSRKNPSLKTTSGTVRKTKQFQQALKCTYIQEQQIIKEQSDQTHNNSMSLSQDLDKLFPNSGRGSIKLDQQSQEREQEFEKLLQD